MKQCNVPMLNPMVKCTQNCPACEGCNWGVWRKVQRSTRSGKEYCNLRWNAKLSRIEATAKNARRQATMHVRIVLLVDKESWAYKYDCWCLIKRDPVPKPKRDHWSLPIFWRIRILVGLRTHHAMLCLFFEPLGFCSHRWTHHLLEAEGINSPNTSNLSDHPLHGACLPGETSYIKMGSEPNTPSNH